MSKQKDERKFEAGELIQEKQAFQRYLRDSQKWQTTMLYIGIAIALILLGIFTRLVLGGITG